jgi:hypothetical protein
MRRQECDGDLLCANRDGSHRQRALELPVVEVLSHVKESNGAGDDERIARLQKRRDHGR